MVLPERRLMLNALWIATIHRIGRAFRMQHQQTAVQRLVIGIKPMT
jgi:hypothetical protein